jgi:hypothetical protein
MEATIAYEYALQLTNHPDATKDLTLTFDGWKTWRKHARAYAKTQAKMSYKHFKLQNSPPLKKI